MGVRKPPQYIVEALKRYDSDLGLEWDDRKEAWFFTWRGRQFLRWEHEDGVAACRSEALTEGEALRIIKKADTKYGGGVRIKAMMARHREKKKREKEEKDREFDNAAERASDRARVKMNGPRPFVSMAST